MKRRRRMMQPLGGLSQRAKGLWEQFRQKSVGLARRNELIAETHALLKGHYKEMSAKHDCSRIVQAILKNGTAQMRRDIWLELSDAVMALAKDEYAHPVVAKLLRYGGAAAKEGVRAAFKGGAVRAMTHARAAVVLEEGLQRGWSQRGAFELLREAMGHEHRHAAAAGAGDGLAASASSSSSSSGSGGAPTSAAELLGALPEADRLLAGRRAARAMAKVVQVQADKKLLGLQMSQRLLDQCLQVAEPAVGCSLVPVCRDAVLALLSSREGGRAACVLAGLGSAKDRKVMARALSEHIDEVACHDQGHMLVVRLLAVTDDTKMLYKALLKPAMENVGPLSRILRDAHGRKVFLSLLAPCHRRYFTPKDVLKLAPLEVPKELPKESSGAKSEASAADGEESASSRPGDASTKAGSALEQQAMADLAAEVQDDSATAAAASRALEDAGEAVGMESRELVPASKKDPAIRRGELLDQCKVALADCVQTRAATILCGEWSWPVAIELVRALRERALRSLGVLAEGALEEAEDKQGRQPGGSSAPAARDAKRGDNDEVSRIRGELSGGLPTIKESEATKDLQRVGRVLDSLAESLLLAPSSGEAADEDGDAAGLGAGGKKRSFFGGAQQEDEDEDEDDADADAPEESLLPASGAGADSGPGSAPMKSDLSQPEVASVLEHHIAHKAIRLLLAQDEAVCLASGKPKPDKDLCLFAPRVVAALCNPGQALAGGGDLGAATASMAGDEIGSKLASYCGSNRGAFTVLQVIERGSQAGATARKAILDAAAELETLPPSAGLQTLRRVLGLEEKEVAKKSGVKGGAVPARGASSGAASGKKSKEAGKGKGKGKGNGHGARAASKATGRQVS